MPRKVKMSPIITDSYVPPELNRQSNKGFSPAVHSYTQPKTKTTVASTVSARTTGFMSINPLDAYRVSDVERWQRVHDKALDLALSCKDDAYKMDAYVDVAIVVAKHMRQIQPSAWAKIKAYWAGL